MFSSSSSSSTSQPILSDSKFDLQGTTTTSNEIPALPAPNQFYIDLRTHLQNPDIDIMAWMKRCKEANPTFHADEAFFTVGMHALRDIGELIGNFLEDQLAIGFEEEYWHFYKKLILVIRFLWEQPGYQENVNLVNFPDIERIQSRYLELLEQCRPTDQLRELYHFLLKVGHKALPPNTPVYLVLSHIVHYNNIDFYNNDDGDDIIDNSFHGDEIVERYVEQISSHLNAIPDSHKATVLKQLQLILQENMVEQPLSEETVKHIQALFHIIPESNKMLTLLAFISQHKHELEDNTVVLEFIELIMRHFVKFDNNELLKQHAIKWQTAINMVNDLDIYRQLYHYSKDERCNVNFGEDAGDGTFLAGNLIHLCVYPGDRNIFLKIAIEEFKLTKEIIKFNSQHLKPIELMGFNSKFKTNTSKCANYLIKHYHQSLDFNEVRRLRGGQEEDPFMDDILNERVGNILHAKECNIEAVHQQLCRKTRYGHKYGFATGHEALPLEIALCIYGPNHPIIEIFLDVYVKCAWYTNNPGVYKSRREELLNISIVQGAREYCIARGDNEAKLPLNAPMINQPHQIEIKSTTPNVAILTKYTDRGTKEGLLQDVIEILGHKPIDFLQAVRRAKQTVTLSNLPYLQKLAIDVKKYLEGFPVPAIGDEISPSLAMLAAALKRCPTKLKNYKIIFNNSRVRDKAELKAVLEQGIHHVEFRGEINPKTLEILREIQEDKAEEKTAPVIAIQAVTIIENPPSAALCHWLFSEPNKRNLLVLDIDIRHFPRENFQQFVKFLRDENTVLKYLHLRDVGDGFIEEDTEEEYNLFDVVKNKQIFTTMGDFWAISTYLQPPYLAAFLPMYAIKDLVNRKGVITKKSINMLEGYWNFIKDGDNPLVSATLIRWYCEVLFKEESFGHLRLTDEVRQHLKNIYDHLIEQAPIDSQLLTKLAYFQTTFGVNLARIDAVAATHNEQQLLTETDRHINRPIIQNRQQFLTEMEQFYPYDDRISAKFEHCEEEAFQLLNKAEAINQKSKSMDNIINQFWHLNNLFPDNEFRLVRFLPSNFLTVLTSIIEEYIYYKHHAVRDFLNVVSNKLDTIQPVNAISENMMVLLYIDRISSPSPIYVSIIERALDTLFAVARSEKDIKKIENEYLWISQIRKKIMRDYNPPYIDTIKKWLDKRIAEISSLPLSETKKFFALLFPLFEQFMTKNNILGAFKILLKGNVWGDAWLEGQLSRYSKVFSAYREYRECRIAELKLPPLPATILSVHNTSIRTDYKVEPLGRLPTLRSLISVTPINENVSDAVIVEDKEAKNVSLPSSLQSQTSTISDKRTRQESNASLNNDDSTSINSESINKRAKQSQISSSSTSAISDHVPTVINHDETKRLPKLSSLTSPTLINPDLPDAVIVENKIETQNTSLSQSQTLQTTSGGNRKRKEIDPLLTNGPPTDQNSDSQPDSSSSSTSSTSSTASNSTNKKPRQDSLINSMGQSCFSPPDTNHESNNVACPVNYQALLSVRISSCWGQPPFS